MRVSVLNKSVTGLALGYRPGDFAISPAILHNGKLWWKKSIEGFAVQVVEQRYTHCGAFVDSHPVWATRAFRVTAERAAEFADLLRDPITRAALSKAT